MSLGVQSKNMRKIFIENIKDIDATVYILYRMIYKCLFFKLVHNLEYEISDTNLFC